MAAAQRVTTIDLGASMVKLAEFAVAKNGGLTLLRFGVADLGLDPNKEEERGKFITPTLAQILKAFKLKGREVNLSISGQSVFMRFVKLPPVDAAQVEQVVTFEAQQNVPFPIQEVTWDYQMMPPRTSSGTEAEAVIVAIKKEVVEAEIRAVEEAGVRVKRVDVAPFALLNAYRYSDPNPSECTLIIDMGARATNVLFVEKSSFWVRNIPIAGNQISQAICNDMQEPFQAAELLKKTKGFVSLGGIYADPDDVDAARMSKLIRATMTRLHVDINRSIAYYRTTLGGASPKRVLLTGGSSGLPYLDLFFADKLSLPVTMFNPLRNVSIGSSLDRGYLQRNHALLSELVGLAARETGSCPAEISLEAPILIARRDKKRKQPYLFAALFCWILVFVLVGLYYQRQVWIARDTAAKLAAQTVELSRLAPSVTKNAAIVNALQATLDQVVALGDERNFWPAALNSLNAHIPEGVWITTLRPVYEAPAASAGLGGNRLPSRLSGSGTETTDRVNVLLVNGLYHANTKTLIVDSARLGDFVDALASDPLFDIDKSNPSQTLTSYTTMGTDPGVFAQRFSMHLKLKVPLHLTPP